MNEVTFEARINEEIKRLVGAVSVPVWYEMCKCRLR